MAEEKKRPAKIVKTIPLKPSDHQISVTAYGIVVPARKVTIEPQVEGRIIRQHDSLSPGGRIGIGMELFTIDSTLVELTLQESIASVVRAEAEVSESLRKKVEGQRLAHESVIPETELAALDSDLRIQSAELDRLSASLSRIRELLKRHTLYAPFNALVLDEAVEIGQRVDSGYRAATLVGTDEFWIQASLTLENLKWVTLPSGSNPGAKVDIYFDRGDNRPDHYEGRVIRLLGNLEKSGRMARVLIEVENPLNHHGPDQDEMIPLLLDSYVRVEIDAGSLKNVLQIDRAALREADHIWVATAQDELQIRKTHVRWQKENSVLIDNVLRKGELLITSPLRVALPGMKIQIQKDSIKLEQTTDPNRKS